MRIAKSQHTSLKVYFIRVGVELGLIVQLLLVLNQTLKEWVNENEVARQFYKEQLKARNEIIQDNLDNSYELLIAEAPTVANELLKIIKNQKTKGYAKTEAINAFFRIIERGWSDKKMSEALQETKERIDSLEAGRPLQLTETPL